MRLIDSPPRLEIESLSRSFGKMQVVSRASLRVGAGQVACLLGPSGCGKTTLLRLISGIDEPNSGEVRINGKIVFGKSVHIPAEHRSVGLMFQDFALFPHLTVSENIAFGLVGRRLDRKARIAELLHKVRLEKLQNRYPHEISGGEQQRVALARAIAPRPQVMLLDEPFSSFDDRLRDRIREDTLAILRSEGAAVLLVTHVPAEAMRVADEIILMRRGEIVQSGVPLDLYFHPCDREAAEYFSDLNVVHGVVKESRVKTIFGDFDAADFVDDVDVEIMIRPQHVLMDFDRSGSKPAPSKKDGVPVRGEVRRSTFLGNASLVEFQLEAGSSAFKALVPSIFLPKRGQKFWLRLARNRCFLFPCITQSTVKESQIKATKNEEIG